MKIRAARYALAAALVVGNTIAMAGVSIAQETEIPFGKPIPKLSYGQYVRVEASGVIPDFGRGNWRSPGYPAPDPDVFFDVSGETSFGGTAAFGFDLADGKRADVSFTRIENQRIDAPFSYTVPASAATHADVNTSLITTAIMANGFYDLPTGNNANPRFSTFVTAGLGIAFNKMGDWTRTNPTATRPVRTFEGATKTSLAWAVGAGASFDISKRQGRPMFLDMTYRYMDFGKAKGSTTPLPMNGSGTPVRAFNFRNTNHAIAVGIRFPL